MTGVFVVLVGVAMLLRALNILPYTSFWITFAVLVILAGLQNIFSGYCKCCDKA
jgi:cell wall-active antibiotic response 4TMS protein YvqF